MLGTEMLLNLGISNTISHGIQATVATVTSDCLINALNAQINPSPVQGPRCVDFSKNTKM